MIEPDVGQVFLGQNELREIDTSQLQDKIGYVGQDPVVFEDTVFNNVTLWADFTELSEARFWEACENAAIADYVKSLPKGPFTLLGQNGLQMSGGQRQRLNIARELYRDVSILIFDEATSSLDSVSEKLIQENIDKLAGYYTIIVIAHRLSTIRNSDTIFLLGDGTIIDRGTFKELSSRNNLN